MRMIILSVASMLAMSEAAIACSPSPTCWISEGSASLRPICRDYAKAGKTLKEIEAFLDQPEKAWLLGRSCKKLGFTLKAK